MVGQPLSPQEGSQLISQHFAAGQFPAALSLLQKLRTRFPNHPQLELQRTVLTTDLSPLHEWSPVFENLPANLWPLEYQCLLAQLKTIWSWAYAQNDFPDYLFQLHHLIQRAEGQGLAGHTILASARPYAEMFQSLAAHGPAPALNPSLPPLHLLGDSNTLPPLHQTVQWNNTPHQIHSHLLVGIQLWQLANPKSELMRQIFLHHLNQIPANAPTLISVGEIDARPTHGIFRHAQKYNKPVAEVIAATIPPAVAWLAAQRSNRSFILAGVPTPNTPTKLAMLSTQDAPAYIAAATAINTALKTQAAKHNLPFLNLFACTTENPSCFTDGFHLTPTTLPQALSSHLLT